MSKPTIEEGAAAAALKAASMFVGRRLGVGPDKYTPKEKAMDAYSSQHTDPPLPSALIAPYRKVRNKLLGEPKLKNYSHFAKKYNVKEDINTIVNAAITEKPSEMMDIVSQILSGKAKDVIHAKYQLAGKSTDDLEDVTDAEEVTEAGEEVEEAYSKSAVDKAIAASARSGRKIGGSEAKMIHALLRGRQTSDEPDGDDKKPKGK